MKPTSSHTAEVLNIPARAGTADQRDRIFTALRTRNRFVEMLRFAVPAFGIVVFGGLVLQLFFANLGDGFGFSDISIDRNNLVVDTPSYSSTGVDGSSYHVAAASARSALNRTDVISLTEAVLTLSRPNGVVITATAAEALLETAGQTVSVDGVTHIADSQGMNGTLVGVLADFAAETVTADGPVDVAFPNGATLEAERMSYDGKSAIWAFTRVTLNLQSTPGETPQGKTGLLGSLPLDGALRRIGDPGAPPPEPAGRRPKPSETP